MRQRCWRTLSAMGGSIGQVAGKARDGCGGAGRREPAPPTQRSQSSCSGDAKRAGGWGGWRAMAHATAWPALFDSAFRLSKNAMVLLDEQRRVVDGNAALVQLIGKPRTDIVGRRMAELIVDGPMVTDAEW